MDKKCRHCGFNNPPDVDKCLYCHKDLPKTVGEIKEGIQVLKDISSQQWGKVGDKLVKDTVSGYQSDLKYKFSPIWILKLKLHGFKKAVIGFLWFLGVIAILVIIGLVYKLLGGK